MPLSYTIPLATPCVIDPAVTAPVHGTLFSFEPKQAGGDFSAIFQATGTVTTLVAALQISLDGGVTFTDYIPSASFFPANTTTNVKVAIIAGALYQINYTTASGSIVMRVCSN